MDQSTITASVNIFELETLDIQFELLARGLNYTGSKVQLAIRLARAMEGQNSKIIRENEIKALGKKVKLCIGLNSKAVLVRDCSNSGESIDTDNVLKTEDIKEKFEQMKKIEKEVLDRLFGSSDKSTRRLLVQTDKDGVVRTFLLCRDVPQNDPINKIVENIDKKRVATSSALGAEKKFKIDINKCETSLLSDTNKTSTSVSTSTDNESDKNGVLNKREENIELVSSESLTKSKTGEKLEERKACFDSTTNADEKTKQLENSADKGSIPVNTTADDKSAEKYILSVVKLTGEKIEQKIHFVSTKNVDEKTQQL